MIAQVKSLFKRAYRKLAHQQARANEIDSMSTEHLQAEAVDLLEKQQQLDDQKKTRANEQRATSNEQRAACKIDKFPL